MATILPVVLALLVAVISTSSMRRAGRMTRGTQMVLIGIFVGALIAVVVLASRNAAR